MSATVDNRIVEMQFNNQQFERNSHESISTLEKLKKALNFDKSSSKALDDLNKKSKAVNLDSLAKSVEDLSNRFSTLGIIGMTALQKIANQALGTAERLAKSLSIDQMTSGFSKYEAKTNAVQVMMVNTGESIDLVNEKLERLQHYTDETSYSYSQMVDAIGKFTSAGVDIDVAEEMAEGIANWAATAGVNAQRASIAFYNLSQAVGAGALKAIDAKSLNLINMFTPDFNKTALEAAVAIGTVRKEGEKYISNLSDTELSTKSLINDLKDGWLSTEVLQETLHRYADTTEEFGKKAYNAAYEAKTFSDALEAVKDSVSSGWSQTYELIFGNYDEARKLWTAVATIFQDLLGGISEARNEMLKTWKDLGGNNYLILGLLQGLQNILYVLQPIKEAFISTFGSLTPEKLTSLTQGFYELMKSIEPTEETLKGLDLIFSGFFSAVKGVYEVIKAVADGVWQVVSPFKELGATVFELAQFVAWLISSSITFAEEFGVFGQITVAVATALSKLIGVIKAVAGVIAYLISEFFKLPAVRTAISETLLAIVDLGTKASVYIEKAWSEIGKLINYIQNLKAEDLAPYLNKLNSAISFLWSGIKLVVGVIGGLISIVASGVSKIFGFSKGVEDLSGSFGSLGNSIKSFGAGEDGLSIFDSLKEKLEIFKGGLSSVIDAVIVKINKLNVGKAIVLGFGAAVIYTIVSVARALNAVPRLIGTTNKVLKDLDKVIRHYRGEDQIGDTMIKLAGAIGILAGSLFLISKIKKEDFVPAMVGMVTMMAMFGALIAVSAVLAMKNLSARFAANAAALLSIAGSVAILAVGLRVLSGLKWEDMKDGILAIGELMVLMLVTSMAMSKYVGGFAKGAIATVILSVSISKLVESLLKLSILPTEMLKKGLNSLAEIMLMLTVLVGIAGKLSFGSAAGVLAIVASIVLIQNALKSIAENGIGFETIKANLDKFIVVIGVLVGLMKLTQMAGQYAIGGGVAILAMSAALHLMLGAIAVMGIIAKFAGGTALLAGMAALLPLIGMMKLMFWAISDTKDVSLRAALALIPMTLCITMLGTVAGILGFLPLPALAKGAIFISLIGNVIVALVEATGAAANVDFKPILAMVAGIGIMAAGLAVLSFADPGGLIIAAAALGTVLYLFGEAMKKSSEVTKDVKLGPIIALVAALGVMIAGLAILSNPELNWLNMIIAATSLGIIMLALGGAMKLAGNAGGAGTAGTIIAMAGALAILSGSLYLLAQVPFEQLVSGLLGLVGVLAVFAAGLMVMQIFGSAAPLIAALGAALVTVAGAFALFGLAALEFAGSVRIVVNAITTLSQVSAEGCQNIYNVIVTFFGALGTGVATMIVNFFATIGNAVAEGIESLKQKFTGSTAEFQNAGFSIIDAIKIGIMNAMPWPIQAAAMVIDGVIGAIRGKKSEVDGAGADLVGGISSSISSAAPMAKEASAEVGGAIEDGIREELQWHSPMIEKFGALLTDLALGISSGQAEGSAIAGAAGEAVGDATGSGCYNLMKSWMPDIKATYAEFCAMRDDMRQGLSYDPNADISDEEKRQQRELIFKNSDSYNAYQESQERVNEYKKMEHMRKLREAGYVAADEAASGKKKKKGKGGGGGGSKGGSSGTAKEMKKLFDVMKDGGKVVQKFAENFGVAYQNIADAHPLKIGQEAVQKLADKIYEESVKGMDASELAAKTAEDKLADMRTAFVNFYDGIKSSISGAVDEFGKFSENAATFSSYADWNKALDRQKIGIKSWESEIRLLAKRTQNYDLVNKVVGWGPENVKNVRLLNSMTDKELKTLSGKMLEAGKSFDNVYADMIMADVAYTTSGLEDIWSKTNEEAAETAEETAKDVTKTTENAVGQFATSLNDGYVVVSKAQSAIIKGNDNAVNSFNKVITITDELKSKVTRIYSDVRDTVESAISSNFDIFEKFDKETELTGDELLENMESRIHGTRDWQAGISELIGKGLNEGLAKQLMAEGTASYDKVKAMLEWSESEIDKANSLFEQSLTIASEVADALGKDMATAGVAAAEGFVSGFGSDASKGSMLQSVRDAVNTIIGEFNDPNSGIAQVGTAVTEGTAQGIADKQSIVDQAGLDMVNNAVVVCAAGAESASAKIGEGLVMGLVEYLESPENTARVAQAYANLGQVGNEAYEDEEEINSPSKVFANYGKYIVLGLVNGLTNNAVLAEDAMTSMGSRALDSMKSVVGHIADIVNGEVQVDPTIRPVLDLSNVEAGAATIGSMFGGRSYSLSQGLNVQSPNGSINDLMAQVMANQTPAPAGSPINMYVYAAPGQSEEEIANMVEQKLMFRINRNGGVWR